MQFIRGKRRTGVRRTRRKGTLVVIVLGIIGVSYIWQVSRQNSETVNSEKFSSEAGNLRLFDVENHKNTSKYDGLLRSTVAMATDQSIIQSKADLLKIFSLKSKNESKRLPSSSSNTPPVKLSSQGKILTNSSFTMEIHMNRREGERDFNSTNMDARDILNRNISSDPPPVRSHPTPKGKSENKVKQMKEGIKVESARTDEVRKDFQNKIQDTGTSLVDIDNEESLKLLMMMETYNHNYTKPRYSFSQAGQFQLQKFARELKNLTRNVTFESSHFSVRDKIRLTLLSNGGIREIYTILHHPKLKLVAFDTPLVLSYVVPIESCPVCATIKSPADINEVFAFHVDRVLGINRALPVVARIFQDSELENLDLKGDEGMKKPRPLMWFAKDLNHGGKFQKDQNSFQLNWRMYQKILSECHRQANLTRSLNCTEINYSDWSRMAVLDFVMQNHDRLDRYCCGYNGIDEGEICFQNEIRDEIEGCDDIDNRYLVHILTSKSNPHQLVLLDNHGNFHRSKEHLNFEILKGIRTIPKTIMKMIFSENLRNRLLDSLKWDSVYWESSGEENIKRKVHTILDRVNVLKNFILTNNITMDAS